MILTEDSLQSRLCDRYRVLEASLRDYEFQAAALRACKEDVVQWVCDWVFTYDPRNAARKLPAYIPFDLWERQKEYLYWLEERVENSEEFIVEKSRDVGLSWLNCAFATHKWLFHPGFKTAFGANKAENVDRIGAVDSLLEKVRMILRGLPDWMVPIEWEKNGNNYMRIMNPDNGNTITGEAGDNMGRGGRSPQPLDAKILTPSGWTTMGEMAVGDEVIGRDGRAKRVVGVYPQGKKQIYRVTFSDGSSTRCTDDHLWRVTTAAMRKNIARNRKNPRAPHHAVLTLREIRSNLLVDRADDQKQYQYQVPMTEPVQFQESAPLPLDPYLLGALIGDGALGNIDRAPAMVCSSYPEFIDEVSRRLPGGMVCRHAGGIDYRLVDPEGRRGAGIRNPLKQALFDLGLAGTRSHTKFVPERYLLASIYDRVELLRGLLDTDGWVSRRSEVNCKVGFCSTSRQLVDDVIFLVRSLGGTATISRKEAGTRLFPHGRECAYRETWSANISMPPGINPFKVRYKAEKFVERSKYAPRRSIVSVDWDGVGDAQCIEIEGDERLYLTDDLIVTHNTIYIIDEAAFVERCERADAATAATAEIRGWVSSVHGMGCLFARKRWSGDFPVFTFSWHDDPRKDQEWADKKQKQLDPVVWATEYGIDYHASVEGICIPGAWVEAAVELEKIAPKKAMNEAASIRGIAGLDVGGGGSGSSVFAARYGPRVTRIESWGDGDTTHTANLAASYARETEVDTLNFDAIGIGAGVASTLMAIEDVYSCGIHVGQPPSDTWWADDRRSKDKFLNLKAELWWLMRERFRLTHEYVLFKKNKEGGVEHPIEDLISIPNHHQLRIELSAPRVFRRDNGKVAIESKEQLAIRGIASPDHADALALTFVDPYVDRIEVRRAW